jgi:hypothetical protein
MVLSVRMVGDDLTGPEIRALLETRGMLAGIREGSAIFDFDGLNAPDVTFWSIWDEADPSRAAGRWKNSMSRMADQNRCAREDHLRKGVGAKMLTHIISEARGEIGGSVWSGFGGGGVCSGGVAAGRMDDVPPLPTIKKIHWRHFMMCCKEKTRT